MDLIYKQKGDSSKAPHPLGVLIFQIMAGISDCYVVILPQPPSLFNQDYVL